MFEFEFEFGLEFELPCAYRVNSGVEPCFFTACKVRSFELALLLVLGLSTASGIALSEE